MQPYKVSRAGAPVFGNIKPSSRGMTVAKAEKV
jgi:hypothetical protein